MRQWIQTEQFWALQPARWVGKTRVCGIHGARGLGGCFRISPLKAVTPYDLQRLRRDCAQLKSRQKKWATGNNDVSQPDTEAWCKFLFQNLQGGMPNAAHVTTKKRGQRLNNQSLAEALGSFLQQWQAQTQTVTSPGSNGHTGQSRKVGWQDRPRRKKFKREDNSHHTSYYDDATQRWSDQDNESSLLSDLLVFLQQCQNKQMTDAEDASQMTSRIATWKGNGHRIRQNSTKPIKMSAPARDTPVPPVTAVQPSEWAAPPIFCPKGKVVGAVSAGLELEGNVTFARTLNDFWEIRDLWKATKCPLGLTVLVEQNGSSEGGLSAKLSVKRGPGPLKPEPFSIFYLGDLVTCPRPKPPVTTNLRQFQPQPKVTLRISAPAQYREAFLESETWDTAKSILLELAQWRLAPASTFTGASWTWNRANHSYTLIGHIRVAGALATELCAQSGRRGIMITETGVNQRREKIVWIPKSKDVGHSQYFQEAIRFAEQRKQSLKFRTGGGADLGVVQLPNDSAPKKPFLVDLLGAPASWEGHDLTELLVSQGWSDIQIVTRKKVGYRSFKWILKGLPPDDSTDPGKNTWQYLDTEGSLHFYITKTVTRGPKVQECIPVQPPRKKFHMNFLPKLTEDIVDDTQIDESQAEEDSEAIPKDGTDKRSGPLREPTNKKRQKAEVSSSSDPQVAQYLVQPSVEVPPSEIDLAIKRGWKPMDMKGTGDCGFRSIAAALQFAKDGQILTEEESRLKGAALRGQATDFIRKHSEKFMPVFHKDKDASPSQEAEDPKQAMKDWLEATHGLKDLRCMRFHANLEPRWWFGGTKMICATHYHCSCFQNGVCSWK